MGAKTLLTVEHLERLPETVRCLLRARPRRTGRGVFRKLFTQPHSRSGAAPANDASWTLSKNPSAIVAEQWFRLSEDTVRAPDVALIAPSQLPLLEPERRIQPFSPALAIEITSPSNTFDELARKTQQYLEAGTRAVWIFVTAMREIHVYSATAHPAILTADRSSRRRNPSARILRAAWRSYSQFDPAPAPAFLAPVRGPSLRAEAPVRRRNPTPHPAHRRTRPVPRRQASSLHRSHTRPPNQLCTQTNLPSPRHRRHPTPAHPRRPR